MTIHDWPSLTRDERIIAIRPLVAKGLSASKIAAHFENVTRNGIIGYCHRHDIPLANSRPRSMRSVTPVKQPPKRPRPAPPKPIGNLASKPLPKPTPAPAPATAVAFMDALDRRLCKWPLWDQFEGPSISRCCGSPRAGSGPYCEYHAELSVGRGTPSERDAPRQLERMTR